MESDLVVTVAIVRSDDTGTVRVGYFTEDDGAITGKDYITADDAVTFLPGETRKEVHIDIIDDLEAEPGDEVFFVTLDVDMVVYRKTMI